MLARSAFIVPANEPAALGRSPVRHVEKDNTNNSLSSHLTINSSPNATKDPILRRLRNYILPAHSYLNAMSTLFTTL